MWIVTKHCEKLIRIHVFKAIENRKHLFKVCTYKIEQHKRETGPRLNMKTIFQVWVFHYKDKTVVTPSNLYNGNCSAGKTTSSYWDGSLVASPTLNKTGYIMHTSTQQFLISNDTSTHKIYHLVSTLDITSESYIQNMNISVPASILYDF